MALKFIRIQDKGQRIFSHFEDNTTLRDLIWGILSCITYSLFSDLKTHCVNSTEQQNFNITNYICTSN